MTGIFELSYIALPSLAVLTMSAVLLLIAGGAAAGFSAGLLGAGGGAILVPVLYYLLPSTDGSADVMHSAVATSLAVMVFTSASATYKQWMSGYLSSVPLRAWFVAVFAGAVAANYAFGAIPDMALRVIFALYLLGSAAYMFIHKTEAAEDGAPPHMPLAKKSAAGAVVGGLSTILGIGGATFTVPFLTSARYSLKMAFAISSATGLLVSFTSLMISATGLVQHDSGASFTMGFISLPAVAIIAPVSMLFSTFGVRMNHKLPEYWLKIAYCALLIAVAADMIFELV